MSSDQQLNVQISIPTNDSQRDCGNPFECSVLSYTNIENTFDDIIAANIVLANEQVTPLTQCGSKQFIKDGVDGTGNLEQNEFQFTAMEENINFQSVQPIGGTNENGLDGAIGSGGQFHFNETGVDKSNSNNCPPNSNDVTFSQSIITEDADKVDAQIDESNEHSSDKSNQKQSSKRSDLGNEQLPKDHCNGTNSNDNEITSESLASDAGPAETTNQIVESTSSLIPSIVDDEEVEKNDKTADAIAPLNGELLDVNAETSNQLAEPTTVNPNIFDDDASSDENELDSNEDSAEFPDISDVDGANEIENDEYILDTVVRKPRKERRRIVSMNDDSDPEMEVERQRLLQSSPSLEEQELSDIENANIELLIQNEKPGPKSKKMSTQKLKELQARTLLRNAVVIPSSGGKKKKSRIIYSDDDDEDNSLLPYCVDVDDIGLPDTNEDNDNESDVLATSSILLNDFDETGAFPIECSKPDEMIEGTPICAISQCENHSATHEPTSPEHLPIQIQDSPNFKCPSENYDSLQDLRKESNEIVQDSVTGDSPSDRMYKVETAIMRDSGNSTDSANQPCSKGNDNNETAGIEFPPFQSSSSSEDDDEFIPNDVYFGTPDMNKKSTRGKGRPRGRPAQSSSRRITNNQNVSRPVLSGRGTARRGRPARRDQFVDNRQTSPTSGSTSTSSSNESDDEYQKSKARRKLHTVTLVKAPSSALYQKVMNHSPGLPIQPIQKQQQIQRPIHHRKRDRFYDKSQNIPNAIYFGDVDVPLHVLHAYDDSDSDNKMQSNSNSKTGDTKLVSSKGNSIRFSSRGRGRTISLPNSYGPVASEARHQHQPYSNSHKPRGRPKTSSVSPSNDRSIQMMKRFLKAAGLKKVKLNRLWEGCKSNSERAAKMLELLREKGLDGEPTISKCRQLKVDYLTKKEIEDLDPNLIIQTEGRTRRSVTRAATKRQYTYDEDEILETRTKLRKIIDSDSDFD